MPKRTVKRNKSLRRTKRRANGGGWSDFLPTNAPGTTASFNEIAVSPGYQKHWQYTGEGKDCTGNPMSLRPGYIASYSPKGLPGMGGGSRGKKNKKAWKKRGGAAMPLAATTDPLPGPVTNPQLPPVSSSVTPKPGDFPNTTGAGGTVANPNNLPVVMSMPGVPVNGQPLMPKVALDSSADAANLAAPKQAGGRYGFFPGMGPLNPINGVGVAPAPFGRIPCEVGTYNPLNPNPNDIQLLSTAPLTPPFVTKPFSGGAYVPEGTSLSASRANFPVYQVGQVDAMRLYTPTAGYRNDFATLRAPSAVPGFTVQTPYPAGAFNQACIKTGGSRKNKNKNKKNKGGAGPVAFDAGKFTPVTINEVWTRKDFDGSNQGLPVKFGGKRKTRRGPKKAKKSQKRTKKH